MSNLHSIGKYQLIAEIARGGMGIVYLAVAKGPGGFSKLLVLKELRPELVDDPTYLQMFLEEARLSARLSHPNIVQTYEVGQEGELHYLVMDYLDGRALSRVLRKRSDVFSQLAHLRVLAEVLRGLEYAHGLTDFDGTPIGVVHRDMTPQNVFITFDGQVKVVDFGIAKSADSSLETRTGILKGKPAYMPPEQINGNADARSDVFAVGVMIWEAVTRQKMWGRRNDVEILTSLLKGEIPRLGDVAPTAAPELVAIVDRALAPSPDARYQTARELREALESYLDARGAPAIRDVGPLVATLFKEEREVTRSMLENALAAAKKGVQRSLPTLGVALGVDGTPSGPSGGSGRLLPTPAVSVGDAPPPSGTPERPRRTWMAVAACFGVIAIVLIVMQLTARRDALPEAAANLQPTPIPTAAVSAPTAPPPAPVAAPAPAATELPAVMTEKSAAPAAAKGGWKKPAGASHHAAEAAPAAAPAPAAAKADCNPPFYFEGTKKVFKPGCL